MAWLKLDDKLRSHPKITAAGPLASWLWICGLCYCREHLTDGCIPKVMLAVLAPGLSQPKRHADRLVAVGLWREDGTDYRVHDFLEWNPSRDEIKAKRAEDSARKKNGIQTDSERKDSGIRLDSEKIPLRERADGRGSLSVIASGSSSSEESPRETTRPSSLIGSSIDYHNRTKTCAFVGSRLEVPHGLHQQLRKQLGGDTAEADLTAWYVDLNIELESSGEKIVPTIFKWLEARFAIWQKASEPVKDPRALARAAYERQTGRKLS